MLDHLDFISLVFRGSRPYSHSTTIGRSQLLPLHSVPDGTDNHPLAAYTVKNNIRSAADDQLPGFQARFWHGHEHQMRFSRHNTGRTP